MLESALFQYIGPHNFAPSDDHPHPGVCTPRVGLSCVIARGSFLVREVEPHAVILHRSNKKQLECFVARFMYSAMANLKLIHLRS